MSQADFSQSSYVPSYLCSPATLSLGAGCTHIWDTHTEMLSRCRLRNQYLWLEQKVRCRQIQRCTKAWRKDSFKGPAPPPAAQNRNLARVWLFHSCYRFGHKTITIAKRQCFPDTSFWETAGAILIQFWMLWQLAGLITQTGPNDWGHPLPLCHH